MIVITLRQIILTDMRAKGVERAVRVSRLRIMVSQEMPLRPVASKGDTGEQMGA